jgi:hypothetical protein
MAALATVGGASPHRSAVDNVGLTSTALNCV